MINGRAEDVSTEALCLADNRVLPWSWQGWDAFFVDQNIQLFLNGFAAPADTTNLDGDLRGASRHCAAIVELYKQRGADFVTSLRGSFAVVLWDERQKKLVLGTDHFGTRPIYYWIANEQIAFAPRIGAFAEARQIAKIIEPNSLYFYLNHSFIPAPHTIYQNIHRLEPGHVLEWTDGRPLIRRYWDMTYPEDERLSEADAAELVRSSLQDSVRFSLEGRQNAIGAFLSGGTDSSTVVGLMAQLSSQPVNTFSVGFDEEAYNEISYARIAAKHFKSNAHEYFVKPDEALDTIPTLAAAYDEPFGNSSAIPTYFCLKMARDAGVKVMFSGDGGDEIFGGNERYITEKIFSIYQQVPRPLRRVLNYGAEMLPAFYPWRKIQNYIRKANQHAVDRFFAYQLYYRDHAAEFLSDDFRNSLDADFPIDVARGHYRSAGDVSPLNHLLYIDLKLAVADNDLFKVNRMAEVLGVQVRYPFLDVHVGVTSGTIPASMKVKGWSKRYIFKKAFENFLPDEIIHKKKHGFGLPTGDWLRNHPGFRDLARSLLLDTRSLQRGYFKRPALEGLLAAHDSEPSGYFGSHIWNFMMLELWHRSHADNQRPRAVSDG